MGFKKYLVGANNLPTDFAIGGLPLFSDDIKQLETNANIWGITSVLKGWSVVLSGCLTDQVDTDSNICTITPGLVLIDDIVYEFDGYTGIYPFSIKPGVQTSDERIFKDGNLKTVATEYDYTIRTAFTTVANSPYPSDLSWDEIYFDPFTGQKAEIVLENLAKQLGETTTIAFKDSGYQTALVINRTETNNPILGSVKPTRKIGNSLRWGNIGYIEFGNKDLVVRYSNDLSDALNMGGLDSNEQTLDVGNIPMHIHSYIDTLDIFSSSVANGVSYSRRSQVDGTASGNGFYQEKDTNTAYQGGSAFNLPNPGAESSFSVENKYTTYYNKIWFGYPTVNNQVSRFFNNPATARPIRFY